MKTRSVYSLRNLKLGAHHSDISFSSKRIKYANNEKDTTKPVFAPTQHGYLLGHGRASLVAK
jgi:hypothetical protein